MSTSIDYRVVEAQFRNSNFEKNIAQSTKSLELFKKALDMDESAKSLENLDKAASNAGLRQLANQIQSVSDKFSAMGIIGFTALQRITNGAIDAGVALVKSLSVDQITAGWSKYEQKTSNVQTLVNATGKSVEKIDTYLDKLMQFSDETSYDFTQMTASLSQMITSGGDIEKIIPLIEGIANATSFAGKGATEFSRSIYNLSQSYGQGYLSLMDFRSVEQAGVASVQLKQTFIDVAKALGRLDSEGRTAKGTLVDIGTFSSTLNEKWADKEVMEKAFGRFAMATEAAYKMVQAGLAQTYSEAYSMLEGQFDQVYYRAALAAQEAKTFGEAIASVKDAVSSGWMATFNYIFGGYDVAKKNWTALANDLWDLFAAPAQERNAMLAEWVDLGGQAALWEGLTNIFQSLLNVIYAVRDGFSEIFPMITAKRLKELTVAFRDFTEKLQVSESTYSKIKAVSTGIASALKLMLIPLKAAVTIISRLITLAGPMLGYILSFASDLGMLITNIVAAVDNSKILEGVFEGLTWITEKVTTTFKFLVAAVAAGLNAFAGVNLLSFDEMSSALGQIPPVGQRVATVFSDIGNAANTGLGRASRMIENLKKWAVDAKDTILKVISSIGMALKPMTDRIKSIFQGVTLTDTIGTTLLFGLYQQIKKIATALAKVKSSWAGVTKALTNVLNTAGDTLKSFQNKVNADVLKTIAISVGILAASLFLISRVDSDKMGASLGAVAALFGELSLILTAMSGKKLTAGKAELLTLAGTMVGMAAAISILAGALVKFNELAQIEGAVSKATFSLGILMGIMAMLAKYLSTSAGDKDILRLSGVLLAFGASIRIMAGALKEFSTISWDDIWPGLLGLAGSLFAIGTSVGILKKLSGSLVRVPATLLALGIALSALIIPVSVLGKMNYSQLEQGLKSTLEVLTAVTAALGIMQLTSKVTEFDSLTKTASTLIALSVALNALIIPIRVFGQMRIGELIQGGVALGSMIASLTAASVILKRVPGELTKVAGTLIALSIAVNLLIIPLKAFAKLDVTGLAVGLIALAGSLTLLVAAAAGLGILANVFGGLEKSMLSFGVAALGTGIAITGLSVALATLAGIGAAGITAVIAAIGAFFQGIKVMLPVIEEGLTDILITIANVLKRAAPAITEGLLVLMTEALSQLRDYAPSLIGSLGDLIVILINGLVSYAPQVQEALRNLFAVWFGDASREKVILDILASATALVAVMKMLSVAKKWGKDAVIGAGFTAAATLIIGGALTVLESIGDTSRILQSALAIGGIMTAMSIAMRIAEPLGKSGLGAVKGIAIVAGVITALSTLFGAFQAFFGQNEVVKKIMNGNITFMEYIGNAIGAFIGGIKKGISNATGGESFLTKFSKDLKDFWTNAKGFFEGMNTLNDSVFDNMIAFGKAMLIFTGTKLLDGIAAFIGRSDLVAFSEQLRDAAPNLQEFYNEIGPIDAAIVQNAINAFEGMAVAASKIPTMGGLKGAVLGNSYLALFSKELSIAAPYIKEFITTCEGVSEADVSSASSMASILVAMGPAADAVPKYAGIKQFLTGQNLISLFAVELAEAAGKIVEFTTIMAGAPENADEIATRTGQIISNLAVSVNEIPNLAAGRSRGILTDFGKQMKNFAEYIVDYCQEVAKADLNAMYTSTLRLKQFVATLNSLDTNVLQQFNNLSSSFKSFGTDAIAAFLNPFKMSGKDIDSAFNLFYSDVNRGISAIFPAITGTISTYSSQILFMMKTLMANCANEIQKSEDKWEQSGRYVMIALKRGMMKNSTEVYTAGQKIGELAHKGYADAVEEHSPPLKFYKSGAWIDTAISNGMMDNQSLVYKSGSTIGNNLDKTLAPIGEKIKKKALNTTDETMEGIVDSILDENYNLQQAGASTSEAVIEGAKGLQTGQKIGTSIMQGLTSTLSALSVQLTSRSLESQVWESVYGNTASETDKRAAKTALLESELGIMTQKLQTSEEKYKETIRQYGKSSDEAIQAYNDLLQAQLDLAQKAGELQSYQQEAAETNHGNMVDYARWMAEYQESLTQMGFSLEEIERAARRDTGYDPTAISNGITEATDVASEAMARVKESFAKSAEDVAGSLTPIYLQYGTKSAEALGTGIQNGSESVKNSTVDVVEDGVTAANDQQPQWFAVGESISESIADGITSNSGVVQSAVNALMNMVSFGSGGSSGTMSYRDSVLAGMSVLNKDVIDNLDTAPTITPVIDDSKVKSGVSKVGSLITGLVPGGSTIRLISNIAKSSANKGSSSSASTQSVTNNYNFNQTNNSPKAINRAEVYRDSKNLMSQLQTKTT